MTVIKISRRYKINLLRINDQKCYLDSPVPNIQKEVFLSPRYSFSVLLFFQSLLCLVEFTWLQWWLLTILICDIVFDTHSFLSLLFSHTWIYHHVLCIKWRRIFHLCDRRHVFTMPPLAIEISYIQSRFSRLLGHPVHLSSQIDCQAWDRSD